MHSDLPNAKRELRRQLRQRLREMPAALRAEASRQVCQRLEAQPVWARSGAVLLFAPMPEEVDLWPLAESALAAGKAVALPRFDLSLGAYGAARILDIAQDVKVGQFGIREPGPECAPMPLNRLDLILVPGLAFDLHGCRLGRGKGFYDRLLAAVCGTTCGVAFEEQMVPQVPVEPHDIKVNCIVAPTRWIEL